ncbi:MAG TPA: hypothetical protein VIH59_07625 [Candidatus Tectomicrobia bacterium]|jgi:hypothetical protein
MPERTQTAKERRGLVDHYISELSRLTKDQCPQAAIAVLSTLYEDEDAHLVVFLPEGVCDSARERLRQALTEHSTEILLDTGLLILAGVYETSQQHKSRE